MFCSNCGAQLGEGVRFCSSCGTPIGAESNAASSTARQQPEGILTVHGYTEWYAVKPPVEIYDNNIKIAEVKYKDTIQIKINHDALITFKCMMRSATYYVTANDNHEVQLSFNRASGKLHADGRSSSNYYAQPTPGSAPAYNTYENYNNQDAYTYDDANNYPEYGAYTQQQENRCIYMNNNSLGSLKIYDSDDNCMAKLRHSPLSGRYILENGNGDFILRIDEIDVMKHIYAISIDEEGEYVVAELGKKGNMNIGFGLGHFCAMPIISIPSGNYYGVSRKGDIYVKKNGELREMYVNNELIAIIEMKKGYVASMMSSKSCMEIRVTDNELILYAIGMFLIMDINDVFK